MRITCYGVTIVGFKPFLMLWREGSNRDPQAMAAARVGTIAQNVRLHPIASLEEHELGVLMQVDHCLGPDLVNTPTIVSVDPENYVYDDESSEVAPRAWVMTAWS